jgi:hypothetical protein
MIKKIYFLSFCLIKSIKTFRIVKPAYALRCSPKGSKSKYNCYGALQNKIGAQREKITIKVQEIGNYQRILPRNGGINGGQFLKISEFLLIPADLVWKSVREIWS